MPFDEEEIEHMVSRPTMYSQAGMGLGARAQQFSEELGKELKPWELRQLYKGRGITKQSVRSSFASGQVLPPHQQLSSLEQLALEVDWFRSNNFEVVQIDECTFGPNAYANKQWAQQANPLVQLGKYSDKKYISVCGAISSESGSLKLHLLEGQYLNSTHIEAFLYSLANLMLKKEKKWAIFWDNASIHKSKATKKLLLELPGGPIHAIMNLVARPDLNGIENFWARAKKVYRGQVDHCKVNGIDWN